MGISVNKALVLAKGGKLPISVKRLNEQVSAMVRCMRCPGGPWDVDVILTTDSHMQQLNKQFRKKDKPTDILSFPFHDIRTPGRFPRVTTREERCLGDMFIGLPYVEEQCKEEGVTLESRFEILFAHGLCHLMGYDHEEDAEFEAMQKAENFVLKHHVKYLPKARADTSTSPEDATPMENKTKNAF